jgi:large subunit ribosomal protein L25
LKATIRTEFGKGPARRTRRAGLIPAVIHEPGADVIHISLPGHGTTMALRSANALLELDLDGKEVLALAREIQRNPVKDVIEHVDLQAVKRGQKLQVEVPIHVIGEPLSGVAILDLQQIAIIAEATNLPEHLTVDVNGLTEGDSIHTGQIELPEGVELASAGEEVQTVLTVTAIREELPEAAAPAEGEEAEGEEAAAEEAPAEEE